MIVVVKVYELEKVAQQVTRAKAEKLRFTMHVGNHGCLVHNKNRIYRHFINGKLCIKLISFGAIQFINQVFGNVLEGINCFVDGKGRRFGFFLQ